MDPPPPPRRSLWRFSLRELLLLMLATAAFLGWGAAVFRPTTSYFSSSSFARQFRADRDVIAVLGQVGEGSVLPSVGNPVGGAQRLRFTIPPAKRDRFMNLLHDRFVNELREHGCWLRRVVADKSGDYRLLLLDYFDQNVNGSIHAVLFSNGDESVLVVVLHEDRQPR